MEFGNVLNDISVKIGRLPTDGFATLFCLNDISVMFKP